MSRPVTLITGASAGLGAEFARQCVKRGHAIALAARRRDRMEALAAEIGGDVHIFEADLSKAGAAASLIAELEAEGLAVVTLINNAGFGLGGRFADRPLERLSEMIDLNVRTLTELCHLVLPGMRERGAGAILNVASTAAFQPGPNMAVYYATKAYVLSFTEALHHELKGTGIAVSALCPGPTESEFSDVADSHSPTLERMKVPAAGVVAAGLEGLAANKAVVIPGFKNKVGAQMSRILPRSTMRNIIGRIKV
ncbi:MAG TPA: SDR family oxidoreductase [Allosphingosinicella sp.]|nr:SDR family oxidoreductase [Allosphingosinicella sp.]